MGAPDIRIRFVSDNRELLSLPAQQNFLERAGSLMQGEVKEVKFEDEDVAVQGLVGHPSLASATGEPCIFLVNGRPVSDRAILRAVREGFQNTLKEREIPVCTLSIDLEPHLVDVNVHPQKSEVRFVAPHNIWRVVREGVSRAVNGFGLTANKLFPSNHYNSDIFFQKYRPLGEITINSPERCYDTSSDLHEIRPNDQKISGDDTGRDIGDIAKYLRDSSGSVIDGDDYFSESSISDRLNHPMNSGPSFSQLRYIGQLLRCYLVCEYQSNLFVIDMHAAHERINYNKIRAALRGRPLVTQQLLLPEPIKVGSLGVRRLLEHQSVLDSLGIELEPFGPEEVIVRAIPPFLKPNQLQLALNDIINYSSFDDDRDVSSDAVLAIVEKEIDRLAARMACHASIRGGDEISREQAVALLESLDDEVLSGACPHGRPIVVSFKESEIEKWFGRDR
jgi:DNA mismatch repair protein MutL